MSTAAIAGLGDPKAKTRLTPAPVIRDCSTATFKNVHPTTGEVLRCRKQTCLTCGPKKAWQIAYAIRLASPERLVTLTGLGPCWDSRRSQVNRLLAYLRRDGVDFQLAWHVEPNPGGTGWHAHGWQHGDFVPLDHLQARCQAIGLGWPHIKQIAVEEAPLNYGLKLMIPRPGVPASAASESMAAYLSANGGRLIHVTRQFWRDEHGQPLRGLKAVRKYRSDLRQQALQENK